MGSTESMPKVKSKRRRNLVGILLALSIAAGAAGACTGGDSSASDENLGPLVPTLRFAHYSADHDATVPEIARVLTEGFQDLGLTLEMEAMSFNALVERADTGDLPQDLALRSYGGNPERIDPGFWLQVPRILPCEEENGGPDWCGEYAKLAEEQQQVVDPDERLGLVFEAQEIFSQQLPWWYVLHFQDSVLYNSERWENVISSSPVSMHEGIVPWLFMSPKTDDRTLNWLSPAVMSTWNPLSEPAEYGFQRLVYDTFARDIQGELTAWAAESWEYVDDTTLEVILRDDMTFHDGEEVTAEDAVFSINYFLEWEPAEYAAALTGIKSAEQTGEYSFELKLSEPDASVPRRSLAFLVILPEHVWSEVPESVGVENAGDWDPIEDDAVIGSGPFRFERWIKGEETVLTAFEDHWEAPDYDQIIQQTIGSADAVREAMASGDADIVSSLGLPPANQEQLTSENDFLEQVTGQTLTTYFLEVNSRKAPFDDVSFRKALFYATDRQTARDQARIGYAVTGGASNVPVVLEDWYNAELPEPEFNLERAREILTDAGYGWDGEGRLHMPAD